MKAHTIVEVIIVLFIFSIVLISMISYFPAYIKIWNEYPQCRFAKDPMTCAAILERN